MKHNFSMEGFAYRLRPIRLDDAQFIIDVRLEDAERNKYIHRISRDVSDQEAWLNRYFEREGDYYFVIENRLTGEREGLIGFYDAADGKAEWGRWVVKKGSLAAVESVDLVYRIAFEMAGLNELYCRTLELNSEVVSFHTSIGEQERQLLVDAFEIDGEKYNAVEQYADRDIFYNSIHPSLQKKCAMIFRRNMKSLVGRFQFHHIGVACRDIEKEFPMFSLLGYTRESAVFEDELQGVKGFFITAPEQPRLELMQDINGSGTLAPHIKNGNKMYHFAYTVSDIEKASEVLQRARGRVISPLKQSAYFGKRICFIMLPNMYLIELIEE